MVVTKRKYSTEKKFERVVVIRNGLVPGTTLKPLLRDPSEVVG